MKNRRETKNILHIPYVLNSKIDLKFYDLFKVAVFQKENYRCHAKDVGFGASDFANGPAPLSDDS